MPLLPPRFFNHYLALECLLIFGVLPPALALLKPHGWMYAALWVVSGFAALTLLRQGYRFWPDWNIEAVDRALMKAMILRFIPLALALALFTYLAIPDRLFDLPRERPQLWVLVMVFYPLFSVIPQELLFRSYFFRRYAPLFASPRRMIAASALVFGWVHILLLNPVAVIFSGLGGIIFASTYHKSRSLAAVCIEHALYGCLIFTLGLGYYFYHGQAVR